MISAIVAVDENWGIGKDNELLFDIPEDKKFFREKTEDSIVVMGRKTWDSLPHKPLKNRYSVVVTNHETPEEYKEDGDSVVFVDLKTAINIMAFYNSITDVYIIGGATIYKQLLDYCQIAYVTKIRAESEADAFFPVLDNNDEWECTPDEKIHIHNCIAYSFDTYIRSPFRKE